MSDEDDEKPKTVTAGPAKHLFPVKLAADPDGAPGDAPEDLEVLLSVPTATQNQVAFERFKVVAGAKQQYLVAVDPPAKPTITAATRAPLWCAWSKTALTAPSTFEPVAGFGYPLLARFKNGALVLPNYRELTLRYYNLSGQPHNASKSDDAIMGDLNLAKTFYEALHIRLKFVEGTAPASVGGTSVLVSREANKEKKIAAQIDVVRLDPGMPAKPYEPAVDFAHSGWGLPSDLSKTVVIYWVNELIGFGQALALALAKMHVSGGFHTNVGQRFGNAPAAMIFMQHKSSALAMSQRMAHELGHVLLYDPGSGRKAIQSPPSTQAKVTAFLGKLLGVDGAALYRALPEHSHGLRAGNNLMGPSGGTKLVDWQVAVIRASDQVGDKP